MPATLPLPLLRRERRRQAMTVGGLGLLAALAVLLPHSERGLLPFGRQSGAYAAIAGAPQDAGGPLSAPAVRRLRVAQAIAAIDRPLPGTASDPIAPAHDGGEATPMLLAALDGAPAAAAYFPHPVDSDAAEVRGGIARASAGLGGTVGGLGGGSAAPSAGGGPVVDADTPPPSGGETPPAVGAGPGGDVVAPPAGDTPTQDPAPDMAGPPSIDAPVTIVPQAPGDPASTLPTPTPPAPTPPATAPTPAIAAGVPEPATWALLLLGFGVTGAAMRRRPRRALA